MTTPKVFQIEWSGAGSNIFFIACVVFFTTFALLSLRSILRNLLALIHKSKDAPTNWPTALLSLFTLLVFILSAVLGGIAGSTGAAGSQAMAVESKGALQGYTANTKSSPQQWLAISLLSFPLFTFLIIKAGYFEQPLWLAVSPQQVTLQYRLPWRDKSIPMSAITDARLVHHTYRENFRTGHFYILTIDHDGQSTNIWCNQRPFYESQFQAAYDEIERQTTLSKRDEKIKRGHS